MGQYFYIVNPNKKQYISAGTFDENNKASGVFYGLHGNAVALLVCKIDEVRRTKTALEGSWFGDEIYVVGDDHGKPDVYGIKTSTSEKPWRNLYLLADEEYENVSLKAIAMMCEWSDYWLEEFVQRIKERRSLGDEVLIVLGNVVFTIGCEPLEEELEKQFGKNWIEKYKEAWLNYGISPLSVSEQWKYTPDSIKDWLKKKRR